MAKETNNANKVLRDRRYLKSNALVNAKGKSSLLAQKIFAIGIQQAHIDENTGKLVARIYGTELRAILHRKNGSFYDQITELIEPPVGKPSIMDWRVIYKDDATKKVEAINLISRCNFQNGILEIWFDESITAQIHELKSNYTVYSLEETIPLKSIYSFRLYEILKSEYDYQSYRAKRMGMSVYSDKAFIYETNLIDLKLKLGIIDPSISRGLLKALKESNPDYKKIEELIENQKDDLKYTQYSNFKRLTLDRAQKELEQKTRLSFDYEEIKAGRGGKVIGIKFFIKFKAAKDGYIDKKVEKIYSPEEKDQVLEEIMDMIHEKLKLKEYKAIAEAAHYNVDKVSKQYDILLKKKTGVDSMVGYLIQAIKEDYAPPLSIPARNSFNNFKQNTYDFDELEKQLIEN